MTPFPRDGEERVSGLLRGIHELQGKWLVLLFIVSETTADSFTPKEGRKNKSLRLECAVQEENTGK